MSGDAWWMGWTSSSPRTSASFAPSRCISTRVELPQRAACLGVPTIAEVPNVTGTVVAYLDVWERLVTPVEDPGLVHSGLGVESCARLKREWVVRTRAGSSVPVPGNADFITGHSY